MKSKIVGLVIVLVVILGFTSVSFAGREGNSGASASATAMVSCFITFPQFADFHEVFEADIWVGGDSNRPISSSCLDCGSGEPCVKCLNTLQELGLSIVGTQCGPFNAGSFLIGRSSLLDYGDAAEVVPAGLGIPVEACTYTLTGNGNPILDRTECGAPGP